MTAKLHLVRVEVARLRPTQMTVGAIEVAGKRKQWSTLKPKERDQLLSDHWFPTVLGPRGECFIVDHHHLGQALVQEKVKSAWALQLADFSGMQTPLFWRLMSFRQWAHPCDETGAICDYSAIPDKLGELRDDPYRSLAGAVRHAGGFAKDSAPFSEFLWADYFRTEFKPKQLQPDATGVISHRIVEKAVESARSLKAQNLPGWTGVFSTQPGNGVSPTAAPGKKSSAKKSARS